MSGPEAMLANEDGQMVLPGLDKAMSYQAPDGQGEGRGQLSSMSQDWYTHPEVVSLVHELYNGPPDLDPMSCEEANRVVKAREIYTAEQDGLLYPWYGRMLWNPPWGGSDANAVKRRGVLKLVDAFETGEVKECVCVLNANAMTTSWFAPLLDYAVCIPSHRIPHYGPGGKGGSPNSGTVIVYVGMAIDRFYETFKDLGVVMVPWEIA